MKQGLKTLCAVSALLFSSDVSAHDPNAFSNASDVQNSGMRDIEVIKEYGNGKVKVTVVHLDNDKTIKKDANGNQEKVFRDRTKPISGITIIGTVCRGLDELQKLCYERGISVHFFVQLMNEGEKLVAKIYELVDPKKKAFHSGISHFGGKDSLNEHNISVAIDTSVCREEGREDGGVYKQYPGDKKEWVEPNDALMGATADLIGALRGDFSIPVNSVNLFPSVTGGRAYAPEPMTYNKLAEKGAVFFPANKNFDLEPFAGLDQNNYADFLYFYGFNRGGDGKGFKDLPNQELFKMFKHQFFSGDLSGNLDNSTKKMILNLVASYYSFEDPIIKSVDTSFRKMIDSYISEKKLTAVRDLIDNWDTYEEVK